MNPENFTSIFLMGEGFILLRRCYGFKGAAPALSDTLKCEHLLMIEKLKIETLMVSKLAFLVY